VPQENLDQILLKSEAIDTLLGSFSKEQQSIDKDMMYKILEKFPVKVLKSEIADVC